MKLRFEIICIFVLAGSVYLILRGLSIKKEKDNGNPYK